MGDFILIQGPGRRGLACAYAARTAGAARIFVSGMGKDEKRLEMAKRFGAHRVINVEKENVIEVVRAGTGGEMADVVVDVSGSPQAIKTSVQCVREQGTTVLAGLTGDDTATPMFMDTFVRKEIRLQGTFTADNDANRNRDACDRMNGIPCTGYGQSHFLNRRKRSIAFVQSEEKFPAFIPLRP